MIGISELCVNVHTSSRVFFPNLFPVLLGMGSSVTASIDNWQLNQLPITKWIVVPNCIRALEYIPFDVFDGIYKRDVVHFYSKNVRTSEPCQELLLNRIWHTAFVVHKQEGETKLKWTYCNWSHKEDIWKSHCIRWSKTHAICEILKMWALE